MNKRSWKVYGILSGLCLLAGFFRYQYALGFLLGSAVGLLLYFRNRTFWNDVVDSGFATTGTGSFHFLINYVLMAASLIACAKFPQYLNIFFCTFGLLMIKVSIIIENLWKGKISE